MMELLDLVANGKKDLAQPEFDGLNAELNKLNTSQKRYVEKNNFYRLYNGIDELAADSFSVFINQDPRANVFSKSPFIFYRDFSKQYYFTAEGRAIVVGTKLDSDEFRHGIGQVNPWMNNYEMFAAVRFYAGQFLLTDKYPPSFEKLYKVYRKFILDRKIALDTKIESSLKLPDENQELSKRIQAILNPCTISSNETTRFPSMRPLCVVAFGASATEITSRLSRPQVS